MNGKKLFFCLGIFLIGNRLMSASKTVCLAATVSEPLELAADHSTIPLKTWQDVAPFAGKFVAYVFYSPLMASKNDYTFSESKIKYGYVEKARIRGRNQQEGYGVLRLVSQREIPGSFILTDGKIEQGRIHIRFATVDEMIIIKQASQNDVAHFSYMSCFVPKEYTLQLLDAHIKTATKGT